MGYMSIDNLYKNKDILMFKECYALEKIHGTSAHISYDYMNKVKMFPGGEKLANFEKAVGFSYQELEEKLAAIAGDSQIIIYGEAYGGSCQGMSKVYGPNLKFVAFDVKINDNWLNVPNAEQVVKTVGLDFVDYIKTKTEIESLDVFRDADSTQAIRNGMGFGHKREGVILRPLIEVTKNNGDRIIAKHKRIEFQETKTPRIVSNEELQVLADAKAVADEWVTEMRVTHVLDKIEGGAELSKMPLILKAMLEDVKREGAGEIKWSREVEKAVTSKTAMMVKNRLTAVKTAVES